MDIERKQSAFIDRFVRQAAELRSAESVVNLVLESRLPPIPLFSPSPWMCFSCLPAAHGKITIELPYDQLMEELDVSSVRELEEFLIKECIHTVQFAAGRDLTAEHLDNTIEASNIWHSAGSVHPVVCYI